MSILAGINSRLINAEDIAAIVSDRVYPFTTPDPKTHGENTYPLIIYSLVSTTTPTTFSGEYIHESRVQVDTYAETLKAAIGLSEAIFSRLHGYVGAMGDEFVGYCLRQNQRIEHDATNTLYRVSEDYKIGHRDAT